MQLFSVYCTVCPFRFFKCVSFFSFLRWPRLALALLSLCYTVFFLFSIVVVVVDDGYFGFSRADSSWLSCRFVSGLGFAPFAITIHRCRLHAIFSIFFFCLARASRYPTQNALCKICSYCAILCRISLHRPFLSRAHHAASI